MDGPWPGIVFAPFERAEKLWLALGKPLWHNTDTGIDLVSRIIENLSTQSLLTHTWDTVYRKMVTSSIAFLASFVIGLLGMRNVPSQVVAEQMA